MERKNIYLTSSILILFIITIIFIYFIPINFLKFITWLGNNENNLSSNNTNVCIVLSKNVD